ncbi:MAG: LPS export ABC transporter periplasmic protein LptC [Candidatus Omnitrophica bacterium]|nr:LPS export ABC transporter periplasmic protein LptC [Candidatus Omnitrophota bacterium]MDD5430003.1 LPS export ABC transporter periplasmic protein LptC [Candidatus Omnitrophota bacterium]
MKLIIITLCFVCLTLNIQAYSQQRIKDFYLSNCKEDGSHDWEVKGDEAMIYDTYVDINTMRANYFLESDDISITSDEARLNKENMDVYLKKNVHVKNKDGAQLTTESLNWQREKNHIETKDWVKTSKDAMEITAQGLSADTQMEKANFEKNVEVTFPDAENKTVTTATCSGPLEIEYSLGRAIFNDDVVVTHPQGKVFSDKTTLYFDTTQKKIVKIVSEGNVKIMRDGNETYAEKATYFDKDQKLVLEGRPRLIYFPKEGQEAKFP